MIVLNFFNFCDQLQIVVTIKGVAIAQVVE